MAAGAEDDVAIEAGDGCVLVKDLVREELSVWNVKQKLLMLLVAHGFGWS
ncbi:hypothetical protein NC653_026715 [Populus alba x Populus x berolinensis]|uniref:Uncharacterized protein n=2 Tax=Populus TaxID=3689 RepID=A0AAD6M402_9ROSI|nr:hypothetical protein NC653_026715 [Populus alba x Populus x berolinensis]